MSDIPGERSFKEKQAFIEGYDLGATQALERVAHGRSPKQAGEDMLAMLEMLKMSVQEREEKRAQEGGMG